MTDDQHSNANTGADATNVPARDGQETASEAAESKELHEVLNESLGTTYKSPEDALTGLAALRDFTGKAGKYEKPVKALMETKGLTEDQAVKYLMDTITQPTEPQVPQAPTSPVSTEFVSRKELDEIMFYQNNPEAASYRTVISAVAKDTGKPLPEVIQLPEIKTLMDAKKANDQTEQSKSVLHSNPRLGVVQDKLTQANEALKAGNMVAADAAATASVLEAFEIK